jgi:hypothetical protein
MLRCRGVFLPQKPGHWLSWYNSLRPTTYCCHQENIKTLIKYESYFGAKEWYIGGWFRGSICSSEAFTSCHGKKANLLWRGWKWLSKFDLVQLLWTFRHINMQRWFQLTFDMYFKAAKICNNMAMAISMLGVSEAFALGQNLGIKANTLTDIFNCSSARCWSRYWLFPSHLFYCSLRCSKMRFASPNIKLWEWSLMFYSGVMNHRK